MRRLRQEFAVVLHGHEHQDWVETDGEGRLVISAGACYESSWMANGYSFGQIDLERQQGGIRLRQWDSSGRGWVPRNVAGKTQDGLWPLRHLPWVKDATAENIIGSSEPTSTEEAQQTLPGQTAEEHYTRRYCQHVIDQHDVLELFGCDIPRELQRHQLSVAYVSLNLAPEDADEPLDRFPSSRTSKPSKRQAASDGDEKQQEDISDSSRAIEYVLDDVSVRSGRLFINGPAGAGKSTLLRWCAIHAAQHILYEPSVPGYAFSNPRDPTKLAVWDRLSDQGRQGIPGAWRRKIPLLIRLRDCPNGRLPAADDLPRFLAKHLPSAPAGWMTGVLESGQALVLFDGVDEIHGDQRPLMEEEIGELIRTYPNCTYVVTTRPGAVAPGWLARLNFTEARVEPMGRRDREEFIDKWYRSATFELKQRPRPGEDLTLTASRLKAELAEQPELGILATNPLLCAMICALYRERREKLPETPAELCEALCHMLLHRRERETPGLEGNHFLATWRALQYPQKKGLLAQIAWNMVTRGDSSIDVANAQTLVAEGLASTPGRTKDEAGEVVQALVERSGLLRPASDDRIDFLHNTLKEYLAAGLVVEAGDWKILAEHADDPAWQPVMLFALALAPESFSSGLVRQLLGRIASAKTPAKKSGSLKKKDRKALAADKARKFFLVRCRAVAKWLAADLSDTIDGFLKHLLPPSSMNEVEALAQIGPRILLYGAATLENGGWWAKQNCHMVARCLRLLRLVGGPKAKSILKAIRGLPSYSLQVNNEWLLACGELSPQESLPWPFSDKVRHLSLSSSAISDISRLEDLTDLLYLDISGTGVTSLCSLTGLKSLQTLILCKTPVSDLVPLSELTSLQWLDVGGTCVNDLSPLARLVSLKELNCWGTKVSDLSPLGELIALQDLSLDWTPIVNLDPLKAMVSLRRFNLRETKVMDLSPLAGLISLQELDLAGTHITDLGPLLGITSLRYLNLAGTEVRDFRDLAKLTSLQHLDLTETKITNLKPLAELTSLKSLNLGFARINDLSPLAGLASLLYLVLREINVTDLSPLSGINSLKFLRLERTAISQRELENFKTLRPDVKIFN
jgi:Leucine-rich repeat (LRR) protein